MATLLARLAAGAHRLEEWSARGMRPVLLGLAVIAVLVVGTLAVVGPGRHAVGWLTGDTRPAHARQGPHQRPEGKAELRAGHAVGKHDAKPGGRAVGKPEGKPVAARPPGPPAPPAPPQPPVAP
jgi:hypothetical protein